MDPSENPYAATSFEANSPVETNLVGQVMWVGILQIVLGGMELLLGGGLVAFSLFIPRVFGRLQEQGGGQPPPEDFLLWMEMMYGGMGIVLAAAAILRIVAGIRSFFFRGRLLMIASLLTGLVSVFTCYCAPMSAGLAIYGLVVILNPPVTRAFHLGGQGIAPAEIKRRMLAQ